MARNKNKLEEVKNQILKIVEGRFRIDIKIVICDFSDPTTKIYQDFEQKLVSEKNGSLYKIKDKIAVLVNNVGIGYKEPYRLADIPEEYYYPMIDGLLNINARSQIHMTRILLKHCFLTRNKKNKKSLIIDISSLSSRLLQPKGAVYGAVKSMNEYFSECMKLELSNHKNIEIQTITPSWIGTKLGVFKPNPPITPTVEGFVKNAFSTIGWMDSTYGYWGFTLQGWMFEIWPAWIGGRISELAYWAAIRMNQERFAEYGKKK